MSNMDIYEAAKAVPDEAKKTIGGGNLKGMTDINPMWRIRKLTEIFGPCGVGWKFDPPTFWAEPGADGEMLAFCSTSLYFRTDDGWSDPIPGIGGSKMITSNKNGLQSSDEAYKMAYTDAISVCCKMLGFGASVYWERGESKYEADTHTEPVACEECGQPITDVTWQNGKTTSAGKMIAQTREKCGKALCGQCYTIFAAKQNGNQGG